VVSATPLVALPPGKRPSPHCTGQQAGFRNGLENHTPPGFKTLKPIVTTSVE